MLISLPEFIVDGIAVPDVDFDVGESYAGTLPVATNGTNGTAQEIFFWFFPTSAEEDPKEIIIWLSGGVCPTSPSPFRR